MFVSAKHFLLGSAAVLLLSLPAMAAEETSSVASVAPQAHALVSCPGMTGVPMTSDAEQALPLRLVATLQCGGDVAVLSDSEGYTALVSSSDGKEGYVARMYLFMGGPAKPNAPLQPVAATAVNGVARWRAGAPGCDQFMSQGRLVESLTANGVTIQVSLQDTGWKLRASIAISNQSTANLDVMPSLITLDELQPSLRLLPSQNPAKIAHAVNHQSFWTIANAAPSASAVVLRENGSATTQSLAYRPNAAPDYMGQHLATVSAKSSVSRDDSAAPLALALKAGSLAPQQKTAGVIWFARDAGARELSLRVPVGNLVFDFPLSFDAHK